MSRVRRILAGCSALAPAGFLILAFALSGLRSAPVWAAFAALFLGWAVFGAGVQSSRPPAAALPFFAWLAAAAVFSADPVFSISIFARQALLGLFFLYALAGEGEKNWLAAVCALGCVCAVSFLAQRLAGFAAVGLIGANPNYSAVFCAAAFPVASLYAARGAGREKWLGAAGALLLAAGILVSGSRGALLAAFLAAAAGLYVAGLRRALAVLLLAAIAGLVLLPQAYLEGVLKFSDPRAFARPRLWGAALAAALREPFFGFGPGLFGRAFEMFKFPYFDGVSYFGHHTPHAHSELFNLAAEAGFPAALFFLLTAGAALLRGGGSGRVKLCALAVLIQGGTDMIFYSGAVSLLFWGSLGFAAAGGGARPGFKMKWPAALLLLFGLAAGPLAVLLRPGGGLEKETYREAVNGKNPALALAVLRRAELDAPMDPFAPAAEGRVLAASGEFRGAAARFKTALALEPFYAGARIGLAAALAAGGRFRECSAELRFLETMPAAEAARNAYERALLDHDRAGFEKLKKELCVKKKIGGAIAPARKAR